MNSSLYFGDVIDSMIETLKEIKQFMEDVDSALVDNDDYDLENDFIKLEKSLQNLDANRLNKLWRTARDMADDTLRRYY